MHHMRDRNFSCIGLGTLLLLGCAEVTAPDRLTLLPTNIGLTETAVDIGHAKFGGLFYGNWCGPDWSGGEHKVGIGTGAPVDILDTQCRRHDLAYHAADVALAPEYYDPATTPKHRSVLCNQWNSDYKNADKVLTRNVEKYVPVSPQPYYSDAPDNWGYDPRIFGELDATTNLFRLGYRAAIRLVSSVEALALRHPPPCNTPVSTISVNPGTASLVVGQSTLLEATAKDRNGAELYDRPFTWSTNNAAVATVSPTGLVSASGPGTAFISVQTESAFAFAIVQVNAASTAVPGSLALTSETSAQSKICIMSKYISPTTPSLGATWHVRLTKGALSPQGVTIYSDDTQINVPICESHIGSFDLAGYSSIAAGDTVYLKLESPSGQSVHSKWTWDGVTAVPVIPASESVVAVVNNYYITEITQNGSFLYFLSAQQNFGCLGMNVGRVSINGGPVTYIASNLPCPHRLVTDGTYAYWTEGGAGFLDGRIRRVGLNGGQVDVLAEGLREITQDLEIHDGFLYFASKGITDSGNIWRIRKLATSGGDVTDLAASSLYPAFTVDGGVVYYEHNDPLTHCITSTPSVGAIEKVSVNGGVAETLASNVIFGCGSNAMTVANGTLYVAHGSSTYAVSSIPTSGGTLAEHVSGLSSVGRMIVDGSYLYVNHLNQGGEVLRFSLTSFQATTLSWWRSASSLAVTPNSIFWIGSYGAVDNCCGGAPIASIVRITR
jgi:hypothetical protein